MNRIRWFRMGTTRDLNILARQISSRSFEIGQPVSSGFRIEKKSKTEILGQFIHKTTVDQKFLLPSGEEFVQEIANIEVVKFGIDSSLSNTLLYTYDAPRSLTNFFSALSETTRFSCTIDPIEVDVMEWVKHIEAGQSAISVIYVDVSGIVISDDIRARFAMSGKESIDSAMRSFFGVDRIGTTECAKIRLQFDGDYFVLELGRRASLKVPSGFPSEGVDLLRRAMLLADLSAQSQG